MPLRKRGEPAPAPATTRPINAPVYEPQMVRIGLGDIKPHPRNANVGDMDSIGESVDELGMFDPLIWNRRNGCLVTGHHTWLTLRRRGWTEFNVVVVDVDEETHVRMMLAHNATAAKGRREEHALADILRELEQAGATRGTGYTSAEVRSIVDRVDADLVKARQSAAKLDLTAARDLDTIEQTPEPDLDTPAEADFTQLPGDLDGVYTLKPDVIFSGVGEWEIPELDPSMIPTYDELPHNIMAWAGSATRDWPDPEQWWLYNIKVDSTSGIQDLSRVIPAFYVYDEYIDTWWNKLSQYVSRMLYSGMQYVVSPDYSPASGGEVRFNSLYSLFRNRYMARYFQQAGLKVIPNVNWSIHDERFLVEHTLPTMPASPNMIAVQIQTATSQARDKAQVAKEADDFGRHCQIVFDTLKPGGALIYYGKVGRELFEQRVNPGCPIIWVEGRTNRLGEKGKRNMAKKTL